jgi:hypothetical protein
MSTEYSAHFDHYDRLSEFTGFYAETIELEEKMKSVITLFLLFI